ncbi:ubiquitin-protein ligase E3B [Lepeophtheirus salmonis]|uniref:ubiquitin-protein ligase E3B n=1 Tax=Lepeophtheirus salmonis TaxID=72036 RepID=UPI001AE61C71|nr:ubiquitin-protein ligase E3B-like [Lepeophtheirus salmonis]XP_040567058.1 ubiquitin-protein ligase E3B-like [Lepeophtheirus salmonis]
MFSGSKLQNHANKNKDAFILAAKEAREERKAERVKEQASITIQSHIRGWLARLKIRNEIIKKFNAALEKRDPLPIDVYIASRNYLNFVPQNLNVKIYSERFEKLCAFIVNSISSESPKVSYLVVFFNKEHSLRWISHMKLILSLTSNRIGTISSNALDSKEISTLLSVLVSFTSVKTWAILKMFDKLVAGMKQLTSNFMGHLVNSADIYLNIKKVLLNGVCSRFKLKKTSFHALIVLITRPIVAADFSDKLLSLFILHILSIPGFIHHIDDDVFSEFDNDNLLYKCLVLLSKDDQQLKIYFNVLEGSYALCLTANLIHWIYRSSNQSLAFDLNTIYVLNHLLESCGFYVTTKQSNLSHWHPILGWFSAGIDQYLQDSMGLVKNQIAKLWSPIMLKRMIIPLQAVVDKLPSDFRSNDSGLEVPDPPSPGDPNIAKQLMKKAMEKTKNSGVTKFINSVSSSTSLASYSNSSFSMSSSSKICTKLGSHEATHVSNICALYQTAIKTLSQLKLEIISCLCYKNLLLSPLFTFLSSLGPTLGLKQFSDHLTSNPMRQMSQPIPPEFQTLALLCDCVSYLVTILDDVEFYEKKSPFDVRHYVALSYCVNNLLYKAVNDDLITDPETNPLCNSLLGLLGVLYRRDNRRQYVKLNHWLIKDCKPNTLITDSLKEKKSSLFLLQKLPHIIPHEDRVVFFRKKVMADKSAIGVASTREYWEPTASTLITVHRSRIVEDGYRHLGKLSSRSLKGVIRVKFINTQGLDEAGIDQDGVFKEFLEETIKRVFDPGLNLFCSTSDNRLYPSPTSHLTENYLQLFEFVGKMIGKAVYEGIVVEIPFAPFFISQILSKDHSAYYSYLDELPSMDPELYKNLTYIKYFDGNVTDLDLTFSYDQDVLGRVVTHELIEGGRSVLVNDCNKISYIHHVAQFVLHSQIKEQVAAFTRGFRAILPIDWLNLFSPPEVLRLISGDNLPLDLKDLRRHTHYYGGFHDSHKVIVWLWEILDRDFDDKERSSFLKFVTSCSKPPLLGFENLEPAFSIRCVEVAEDEDDGDTVGSVLRGFLALKKRDPVNRLPTASTCFNLLKLPNYQKKATLRDKLRYAISSNTGFELS